MSDQQPTLNDTYRAVMGALYVMKENTRERLEGTHTGAAIDMVTAPIVVLRGLITEVAPEMLDSLKSAYQQDVLGMPREDTILARKWAAEAAFRKAVDLPKVERARPSTPPPPEA